MNNAYRMLSRIVVTASAMLVLSGWASGQPAPNTTPGTNVYGEHRFQGYVFVAPGAYIGWSESVGTMHVGAGAEALVYRGLGLGAEAGVAWATQGSDPLGLFSVDGYYHFSRLRKVSPFLAGGYSRVGGDGGRNLVNFGGGVNWWFRENKGILLEFRDHVYPDGGRHLLGLRIGFAFR